jgi:chromosome partitioning protein
VSLLSISTAANKALPIKNRRTWGERARIKLELPMHYCVKRGETSSLETNEAQEFASFSQAL